MIDLIAVMIGESLARQEKLLLTIKDEISEMTKEHVEPAREMSAKFKKKPLTVEAIKWTSDNIDEVMKFIGYTCISDYFDGGQYCIGSHGIVINTLEGKMTASVGDFIIKGVKGELYPCKPDIFEAGYDRVGK